MMMKEDDFKRKEKQDKEIEQKKKRQKRPPDQPANRLSLLIKVLPVRPLDPQHEKEPSQLDDDKLKNGGISFLNF